jgi:hypothetical protein
MFWQYISYLHSLHCLQLHMVVIYAVIHCHQSVPLYTIVTQSKSGTVNQENKKNLQFINFVFHFFQTILLFT